MKWTDQYHKAITFSYDDGVFQDKRLVEILNRYNLKCTFNINSGLGRLNEPFLADDVLVEHFDIEELVPMYVGNEPAIHSFSHPSLTSIPILDARKEIEDDIYNIEHIFDTKVEGMAYPFGDYNDEVVKVLTEFGIKYARTVEENHSFSIQTDLLRFKPTCHHNDKEIFNLIKKFLDEESNEPMILYIWGHSYEFDVDRNWDHFERICQMIANKTDIFYGTNKEVLLNEY
ncbi:MAG: polysaccharide deacetylase family protein [Bacilli bacterium]|nr:polysaccharide deacetylase family protein [Bacilli bacterium]